jgi:hypothetical protein
MRHHGCLSCFFLLWPHKINACCKIFQELGPKSHGSTNIRDEYASETPNHSASPGKGPKAAASLGKGTWTKIEKAGPRIVDVHEPGV